MSDVNETPAPAVPTRTVIIPATPRPSVAPARAAKAVEIDLGGFDPTRPTGYDNPRPTGTGEVSGRAPQMGPYDPDDPARQPPPEFQAAAAAQAARDDAGQAESQERTRARRAPVTEPRR